MTQTAASRRWRLFPRMRIATLLILVAAVGGPMGWYIHGIRVQRTAVRALRDAGARVIYDWELDPDSLQSRSGELSGWRRIVAERFGPDAVATVAAVSLEGAAGQVDHGVTDDHIAQIGRLKSLRLLQLGKLAVSEEGAAPIADLGQLRILIIHDPLWKSDPGPILSRLGENPRLQRLSLFGVVLDSEDIPAISRLSRLETLQITCAGGNIGDAELAKLAALGRLKTLQISTSSRITSGGLKAIGGMKRLESISLAKSSIDDLAPFLQFPALRHLDLGHCQIGDEDLAIPGQMPAMRFLSVASDSLTDAGLARLCDAPALERLTLRSPCITAAGLDSLGAIKSLKFIHLRNCQIPPQEAAEFTKSHPGILLQ